MPATILRPYLHGFRNRFREDSAERHSLMRDLMLTAVAGIIVLSIFLGFSMILGAVRGNPVFEVIIPEKIIELMLFAFFALLILSNAVAVVGNVFSANNMNLLLSAPVSNSRLFFAKAILSFFETTLMFFVFVTPVGLAYAYSLDLRPGLLLGAVGILVPFLMIPVGIGFVLATIFVKLASLFWRRGYLLFLGASIVIGLGVVELFSLLSTIQIQRGGTNAIVQVIGLFDNPNPVWSPARWASDLLSYYLGAEVGGSSIKFMLLWFTALGSLSLGYLVFDLFLLPVRSVAGVHSRSQSNTKGQARDVDFVRTLLEALYLRLPIDSQIRGIILKDLSSTVRDRAQALQLLMYLGIALAYITLIKFMGAALNLGVWGQATWWAFLGSINVLFAGFIITALMTRLVYPSISLEGRAFWILKTAPINVRDLLIAKFYCWMPITLVITLSLLLTGVLVIKPGLAIAVATLVVGVCLSAGCTSLALGIGATFASFEWESPNQISVGFGTLLLLLASLTLVVLTAIPTLALMFYTIGLDLNLPTKPMSTFLGITAPIVFVANLNYWIAKRSINRGAKALAAKAVR